MRQDIVSCAHHVIFITEFILLTKNPPFYEVNSFNRKWWAHGDGDIMVRFLCVNLLKQDIKTRITIHTIFFNGIGKGKGKWQDLNPWPILRSFFECCGCHIPFTRHYNPLLSRNRSRILTIHKTEFSEKTSLKIKKWTSKWGKKYTSRGL